MKKPKKRNAQDATLRNIRALKKSVSILSVEIAYLKLRVTVLEDKKK